MADSGVVGCVEVWLARYGMVGRGMVERGLVRQGMARYGWRGAVGCGGAWHGAVW